MPDREKVIRGWERCRKCHDVPMLFSESYRDCDYTRGMYCRQDILIEDTIALLKEQEPIKPKETGFHMPISISINYECKCGAPMLRDQPFCMKCGRPVKWE